MRDIRSDLRERLEMVLRQRRELSQQLQALEGREQRLRALLHDEERLPRQFRQLELLSLPDAGNGARLRQFVLWIIGEWP